MKKYLLGLIFLPSVAFAATLDSKVETTDVFSGEALIKDNFEDIQDLQVKYDNIENVFNKFQTCEAKNMAYIGPGVAGSDGDDCVNIQSVPVKRKSKLPKWKGFVSNSRLGTLTETTGGYSPGTTSEQWGRARADKLCRNADASNSSRALTANDLKYVYNEIPLSGANYDHSSSSAYLWVFDGHESVDENGSLIAKYQFDKDSANCQGWRSYSSANKGLVLEVTGSATNYYMQQNTRTCNQKALIGCVTDE
tara:strand:- start:897 stop:1649 length:753 start_codon:yes stop_codon:yes gene_type:complete